MEEDLTESASGDLAGVRADLPGESGWIKTRVAAEALGVDPRTVRAYIERGDLVAKSEGKGIQKTYLVSIDSVYTLRDRRGSSGRKPGLLLRTSGRNPRGKQMLRVLAELKPDHPEVYLLRSLRTSSASW
jgi:hypothetical protein